MSPVLAKLMDAASGWLNVSRISLNLKMPSLCSDEGQASKATLPAKSIMVSNRVSFETDDHQAASSF